MTKPSQASDPRRAFVETYQRWTRLFRGRDTGDATSEKWLIAEYYQSLGHLSPDGLNALTDLLKANCTFFPTIKECLDLIKPKDRYDWGHPFLNKPQMFIAPPSHRAIATQRTAAIEDQRHDL